MKPLRFEDFFGAIDFNDPNVTGEQLAQMMAPAEVMARKRAINRAADYLATVPHRTEAIASHNSNAQAWAYEIAGAFGMSKCTRCGRFDFDGEHCHHAGCVEPIPLDVLARRG